MDATRLNEDCACPTLDPAALCRGLDEAAAEAGFCESLLATHPTLFATVPVYVTREELAAMARVVGAIEALSHLPGWQERALAFAPPTARHDPGPLGALMGYDFHLSEEGPQLIEVNTNAGGALVNAILARAQRRCCDDMDGWGPASPPDAQERLWAMFQAEWRRQRGEAPLRTVAVVDQAPQSQFMAPEFHLFRRLFARRGVEAVVLDPGALSWREGRLWADAQPIDLVYNRLTDFGLQQPEQRALQQAWLHDGAVITPHPRAHALLADKRHLVILSDPQALRALGASESQLAALAGHVPRAVIVDEANAEALWAERRRWFFKPFAGHGSKAAWRGDKLTRRVWEGVRQGGHVAQALVPPSRRLVMHGGQTRRLKADLRLYTYDAQVLLVAARLYEGQVTNLRTEGGGFAPVWVRHP